MTRKRLFALLLAVGLMLPLLPIGTLAAGHRFEQVSADPFDDWICADCGAVISPDLKEAYEAVSAQDGLVLPHGVEQSEAAVHSYVEQMTERTADAVGWYRCTVAKVSYSAPQDGRDGAYVYTVTIQSYGRSPVLASITTEPLMLVIPSQEVSSGTQNPGISGSNAPATKPTGSPTNVPKGFEILLPFESGDRNNNADWAHSQLSNLVWFAWVMREEFVLPFTDVPEDSWFYPGVRFVYLQSVMDGVSSDTFAPYEPVTRGLAWSVLARMNGMNTSPGAGETWYDRGMNWAVDRGVSDGTNPLSPVTREQWVSMLWRRAGYPVVDVDLSAYSDGGSVSGYAQDAMRWAISIGIIQGYDGRLSPQGGISRAELATMVLLLVKNPR